MPKKAQCTYCLLFLYGVRVKTPPKLNQIAFSKQYSNQVQFSTEYEGSKQIKKADKQKKDGIGQNKKRCDERKSQRF